MDKRAGFMKRSIETVKAALMSRDMLLSGVTKSIEDLDRIINLLGERLEEWYGIYFPELKLEDRLKYAQLVQEIDRTDIDAKELAQLVGQKKADEVKASAAKTLGASISDEDMKQVRSLANSILQLNGLRKQYEGYQASLAQEICPNMSKVAGPDVAAKLVSHVGSLKRLCMLPASTIQVLGAEKALFKHLKNRRISPPKHGIIFQNPRIAGSPKAVRGKIARALANKLALASKADAITKRYMGDELLKDFEERYNEIMAAYNAEKGKAK